MSTELTTAPPSIKQRLQSPQMISELGKAMPAHCKPERMARIAITALTKTPKLAECTQASFFECLLSLSQWGLEPDGRRAHLIPYGNKCTLIIDYKGYVELAYRSGVVRNIHADVVREGDLFTYSKGRVVEHVPWFLRRDEGKPGDAGKVFAVYCVVELTGGTEKTEVLSQAEVEAIRKRSKAGNNGPWVTDWSEMAKKTAFRRVQKWLPLSADIRDAMDRDDDVIDVVATPSQPATIEDLSKILEGDGEAESTQLDADLLDLFRAAIAAAGTDVEAINEAEGEFASRTELDSEKDVIHREAQAARDASKKPRKQGALAGT